MTPQLAAFAAQVVLVQGTAPHLEGPPPPQYWPVGQPPHCRVAPQPSPMGPQSVGWHVRRPQPPLVPEAPVVEPELVVAPAVVPAAVVPAAVVVPVVALAEPVVLPWVPDEVELVFLPGPMVWLEPQPTTSSVASRPDEQIKDERIPGCWATRPTPSNLHPVLGSVEGRPVPSHLTTGVHRCRGATRTAASLARTENMVSELFDAQAWQEVEGFGFEDITYHRARGVGAVRVAFNRPAVRNAFRPRTVDELYRALDHARMSPDVGCVLLTGNGPSPKDGGWAFCSGGDQRIRGKDGYRYAEGDSRESIDPARTGRLHILEVQRLIRFMPKVVVAVVPGWAAGGGHSLHVVCDLSIASREHARFKQTDADVASFDGGYGSAYLARQVGQKFAREIFFLGETYSADDAHRMGMVNRVVPHAELEVTALAWAKAICAKSPTAQRMLKFAFNAVDDGLVGQQLFAGEATRLAYGTDEAAEGRDSFLEKRPPDWKKYPWHY
jgi:naphthoate synthase